MKKNNRKGFTLAELLIVVAIIAVLVAIAIPIFTNQLEKAKEATDAANVRAAYATLVTKYLTENESGTINVPANQGKSGWQTSPAPTINQAHDGNMSPVQFDAKVGGSYTVTINESGNVTIE